METNQYIKVLKAKTRRPVNVAMRGAVISLLKSHNIPIKIIAECLGYTKRHCYAQYYQTRNLMESGDKIVKSAFAELEQHSVKVQPYVINGDDIFSQHGGYKLIIDNVIY